MFLKEDEADRLLGLLARHLMAPSALSLYLYYKRHDTHTLPGVSKITGLHRRTISYTTTWLGILGLVEITRRGARYKGAHFETRLHSLTPKLFEEIIAREDLHEIIKKYRSWLFKNPKKRVTRRKRAHDKRAS